jgi:NADH-ubiquinone oxidoreductase chain 6
MTAILVISLSLCSVIIFPLIAQPLSLGLSIIISTLFFCVLTAMFLSRWYAYILFLIYVGGLLVIFAYVAALSPNVLFLGISSFAFFVTIFFVLRRILINYEFSDLRSFTNFNNWFEEKRLKFYGIQLASPYYNFILVSLGIILLLNLIVIVKICFYQRAALRSFN